MILGATEKARLSGASSGKAGFVSGEGGVGR